MIGFPESIPWNDEPLHDLEREDEMTTFIGAGQTSVTVTAQLTIQLDVEETENGEGSHAFRDTNLDYSHAGIHFLLGSVEISGETPIRKLWESLPESQRVVVEQEARSNARRAAGFAG